jgi:hypothetical protein
VLHKIVRSMLPVTMVLALAGQLVAAPLAYRMPPGDGFQLETVVDAEVPMLGARHIVALADCRVDASTVDHLTLKQTITAKLAGKPDYTLSMGCDVSPEGRMSNFTGINLEDPKMALVARNAGMGLPTLPNDEPRVGHTWQEEKAIYLPKTPIPGMPESARVITDYKITAMGKAGSRDTVTIEMKMKEADGKLKIAAQGQFVVEAGTGKPVSGQIEGNASIRVVIKTFNVPFKVGIQAR